MENVKKKSWQEYVRKTSEEIKQAVIDESVQRDKQFFKDLGLTKEDVGQVDGSKILDICLSVKSVLAMINFGEINDPSAQDKEFVRRSISCMVDYFSNDENHYNMVGQLKWDYCQSAFGDKEDSINRTMANVFVTFVYFRRAMKRKGFLKEFGDEIIDRIALIMKNILEKWLAYVQANGYRGWGFMIKSKSVNLADTYRVIEAISKYQDACDSSDESKRDIEMIAKIGEKLTDDIEGAMYKVALKVYDETYNCYGEGVFYKADETDAVGKAVYRLNSSEQVFNSNRTSVLFQPLYVAMITMLGYTDKEVVIRKLMTSKDSAESCFQSVLSKINNQEDERKADVDALNKLKGLKAFQEHDPLNELSKEEWKKLYDAARSVEKAFEEHAKTEMSSGIKEYRDYLNKTKDAIDNIQVYYRKFNDAQKLGVVDTDYAIFSDYDIPNIDMIDLSRLNKSNLVTSYLKPLLLSSKIMIVNALTKYPQSDMESLFNDIMNSVYRKKVSKNSAPKNVMLWNEEEVDMYATSSNCDSIAYDYFDYYAKYELNYRAMKEIFNETKNYILKNNALFEESVDYEVAADEIAYKIDGSDKNEKTETNMIVGKLFDLAQEQIKVFKEEYEKKLKEKTADLESDNERALNKKDEEIGDRDKMLKQYEEECKTLEKESEISRVIQKLVERKVKEELKILLGSMALVNISIDDLDKDFINKVKDDDLGYESIKDAATRLSLEAEQVAGVEGKSINSYYQNRTAELVELRDLFMMAISGMMESVVTELDIKKITDDPKCAINFYEKFKKERNAFQLEWIKSTVALNKEDFSLKNVFAAVENQNLYILTSNKK